MTTAHAQKAGRLQLPELTHTVLRTRTQLLSFVLCPCPHLASVFPSVQ